MEMPQSGSSCDYTALLMRRGRSASQMLGWFLFYPYSSPLLPCFIMHQTSDWRPYFICAAFEKYLSSPAGSMSNATTVRVLLFQSAFTLPSARTLKRGDDSFIGPIKGTFRKKRIKKNNLFNREGKVLHLFSSMCVLEEGLQRGGDAVIGSRQLRGQFQMAHIPL